MYAYILAERKAGRTLRELGEEFRVCGEYIRQMECKVLREIRRKRLCAHGGIRPLRCLEMAQSIAKA